jgi:DNA-binding protein H-NS
MSVLFTSAHTATSASFVFSSTTNESEMTDQQTNTLTFSEINRQLAVLQAEMDRLNRLAQDAKDCERNDALTKAQALIDSFGFTAAELTLLKVKSVSQKPRTTTPRIGPKKYRHPETGAEWSGQGMAPAWIKNSDKNSFLNPAWTAMKSRESAKLHPENYGRLNSADLQNATRIIDVEFA